MATVAFSAFVMSLCNKSYSATQFALLTSASTIMGRLTSGSSGFIVTSAGWATFFIMTMVFAIPALFILRMIPERHES
jgi:PAT family beta-lactamase induction signal transducer AmpG